MLVDFRATSDGTILLATLKAIKQDLIGGDKKAYYDKGLIETVVELVNSASDSESLYEMLVILNSFLIDFPPASYVFIVYKTELKEKLQLIMAKESPKIVEMALRIARNLIRLNIMPSIHIAKGVMAKIRDIDLLSTMA